MSGDFVETSRPVMDWVLRTTWEASLIAALVLIAQHLLRGRVSARWRYNLWLLVVARLLLPAVPGTHYSPFNLVRLPQSTPRPMAPQDAPQAAPRRPGLLVEPVRVIPIPGPPPAAPADRPPIFFASQVVTPAPTGAQPGHERVAFTDRPFDDVGATPQAAVHAGVTSPSRAAPEPMPTDVVNPTRGRGDHIPAPTPAPAPARALPRHPDGIPPLAASSSSPITRAEPVVPWHQRINWPVLALLVWVAGAGFVAARLAWVTLRLGVAVRGLRAAHDPALSELLKECAAQLRLRRIPRVLEAPDGFGPALVGLLRPRIVLPACVLRGSFQRDELRLILMHELAHMKRWDVAANWLLAVLGVLHWFNPVLALAFRRMRADREMACDELVLSAAAPSVARAYGPTILKLLQTLSRRPALPGAVGVLEGKQSIRRRIAMIARFDRSNRNSSPLFGVALSVLAGGVALTGAVRGQQQPPPAVEVRELAVELADQGERPGPEEADAAAEAAREQAEAVHGALAERQSEAAERAAEAARALAEAHEQLAALQGEAQQAIDEATRQMDATGREHDDRAAELRRALDEAKQALAEHQSAEPAEGDEAEAAAERARELTSQIEEREREMALAVLERDRALAEAQTEIERARAGQQVALAEARAELERVVAERQASLQEAARLTQEAAAEHQAAVERLAAVQNLPPQPEAGAHPEAPPEALPDAPAAADPAAAPAAGPVPTPAVADPTGLPPGATPAPGGVSAGLPGLSTAEVPPEALPPTVGAGLPPSATVAAPDPVAPVPGAADPAAVPPPTAPRGIARSSAAAPARQTAGRRATSAARAVGGVGAMSGVPGGNAGMAAPAATAHQLARPGAAPGFNPYGGNGGYGSGPGYPGANPGGYLGRGGGYPGMGAPANPAAPNGSIEDPAGRDANTRAARALARPLPVNFADIALADALASLAEQANVDIIADWKSLEAAGVDRNATVSLTLKQGAPAEQVLAWVLRAAGGDALGYAIDHGVVVVAPQERIDRMVITRAYKLGGLAGDGQALEQLVRDTVAPQSWRESGGPAAVRFFNNQLFVTATEPNHRQVERLLGLMEAQNVQPQPGMFPGMMPGMHPGMPGAAPGGSMPGAPRTLTPGAPTTVPPGAQ
jgi:beta-lactamase regulating signal transducer with metallopeptidase domain